MKKYVLFIFIVLFTSQSFSATTGKIAGTIIDAQTKEPLPGVNVIIENTDMGAATDLEGNYFIINVPPGSYNLTASLIGYAKITKTGVQVRIDQTATVDFDMKMEAIEGEEVIVVAEKPVVEIDLTASKEIVSTEELTKSFVTTVDGAINTQQGVNHHGGIRGGFGLDVAYYIDGMEVRDGSSNSNFTAIGTSAIEEMQILTGGYNAEYGRANGAIVNIVTKTAMDRIHGSINYRYRPAGIYHWGDHMFGDQLFEYRVMTKPEYWINVSPGKFYDDAFSEDSLVKAYQIAAFWDNEILNSRHMIDRRRYDERSQNEIEGTIYSPLGSKLSMMVTGRYLHGAPVFPSVHKYNPEWHAQMNLDYKFNTNTKLKFSLIHSGFNNAGPYRTTYGSSEDIRSAANITGAYVYTALMDEKYWLYGGPGFYTPKPPEYARTWSGQLKLTHTINPNSFIELKAGHYQLWREASYTFYEEVNRYTLTWADHREGATSSRPEYTGSRWWGGYAWHNFNPRGFPFTRYEMPGNLTWDHAFAYNTHGSIDYTNQISDAHQIKAGAYFASHYIDRKVNIGFISNMQFNYMIPRVPRPIEFATYVQDKIETKGMIVNLGVRFDLYNANFWTGDDIFDPLRIDEDTPGNIKQDVVSIGDPYKYTGIEEGNDYAVKSPTRYAISPRIGISHPITETTVLHFMYGHFNQRPTWYKITMLPPTNYRWPQPPTRDMPLASHMGVQYVNAEGDTLGGTPFRMGYQNQASTGNPGLEYERMIQYEVGFDQNIADILRLDVTMYYKDAKNLTAAGFRNDEAYVGAYGTNVDRLVLMRPDYDNAYAGANDGKTGNFRIFSNNQYQDVRGIEVGLETQFNKWGNIKALYNMSYSTTGAYGWSQLFRPNPDGIKAGIDRRHGANNNDNGYAGNNNEYWNPHNSLKVTANIFTPQNFGPLYGGFYPLGDWNINIYSTWVQGRQYTYYSPDYVGPKPPNNRRWKPRYNTNLFVSKGITMGAGLRAILSVRVTNLFNQQQLRLPGGSNLELYHETGRLPFTTLGYGEFREEIDDEWTWYDRSLMPRQIIFGLGFEF